MSLANPVCLVFGPQHDLWRRGAESSAEHEDGNIVRGTRVSYERAHDLGTRVIRRKVGRVAGAGGDLPAKGRGELVYAPVDHLAASFDQAVGEET
jgi:hypothetical protein